jgi:hypothetical protein
MKSQKAPEIINPPPHHLDYGLTGSPGGAPGVGAPLHHHGGGRGGKGPPHLHRGASVPWPRGWVSMKKTVYYDQAKPAVGEEKSRLLISKQSRKGGK